MSKEPKKKKTEAETVAPAAPTPVAEITNDQKNLAFICHLSGFFWFVIPGLNIVVPLVVMLVKGNEDPFVSHHSRQALIFQVVMSVAMIVLLVVGLVLLIVLIGILVLGVLLIVAAVDIVFILVATFAAARGEWYTYPLMGRV
ncbi:MAG: DUF4870 domain-containing protein [Deltaproteobacteria bacterium]|nr:DUF4870 domain-containing protein [Candidatus Zymogenaceae bacterium]